MKKALSIALLSLPIFASAQNLVVNGSFESGLTGWTTTNSPGTQYPVAVITYGTVGQTFGESIPADSSNSLSPDLAGSSALYFVDDFATQTVSQTFTVATAGNYSVGFSSYDPINGSTQRNDAAFSAVIGGVTISSTNVSALQPGVWTAISGSIYLDQGSHSVDFTFVSTGNPAKDLVIDRVFVVATPVSATPVPEPETYALMLAGLGALGFMARRRSRA